MSLNDKQQIFVAEYVKNGNATLSAQAAGYSKRTAYSQGARLLKYPEVAAEIKKYRDRAVKKAQVTLEGTIDELNLALGLAMATVKPAAAISAIMAKAKLVGLLDKAPDDEIDDTPLEIRIVE